MPRFLLHFAPILLAVATLSLVSQAAYGQGYTYAQVQQKKIPIVLATIEKLGGEEGPFARDIDVVLRIDEVLFGWFPDEVKSVSISGIWSLDHEVEELYIEPEVGQKVVVFLLRDGDESWRVHPAQHQPQVVLGKDSSRMHELRQLTKIWNARDQWERMHLAKAGLSSPEPIVQAMSVEILGSSRDNEYSVELDDLLNQHDGLQIVWEVYRREDLPLEPLLACERVLAATYPAGNWKNRPGRPERVRKAIADCAAAKRTVNTEHLAAALNELAADPTAKSETFAMLQELAAQDAYRSAAVQAIAALYQPLANDDDDKARNEKIVKFLSKQPDDFATGRTASEALAQIAVACGRRAVAPSDVIAALRARDSGEYSAARKGLREAGAAYRATKVWLKKHPDAVLLSLPWEDQIGKQVAFWAMPPLAAPGLENYVEVGHNRIWLEGDKSTEDDFHDPFGTPSTLLYGRYGAEAQFYVGTLKQVEDLPVAYSEEGELIIENPELERKLQFAEGDIVNVRTEERREVAEYLKKLKAMRGDRKDKRFLLTDVTTETAEE